MTAWRTMQDSDITSGFTPGADIYGAYVLSDDGGGHNNFAAMSALPFVAGKRTLAICSRFNTSAARFPIDHVCLDFEAGTTGVTAADAQEAVAWTVRMRQAGKVPWNYCNESTWPLLAARYTANKVAAPIWWIANTDKPAGSIPGAQAHQYSFNLPRNLYDSSVVMPYIAGFDPAPVPPQPPAPPIPIEVLKMKDILYQVENGASVGSYWLREADTGNVFGVQDGDDIALTKSAGIVNVGIISGGLHEEFLDASPFQKTYTTSGRNNAGPTGNPPA